MTERRYKLGHLFDLLSTWTISLSLLGMGGSVLTAILILMSYLNGQPVQRLHEYAFIGSQALLAILVSGSILSVPLTHLMFYNFSRWTKNLSVGTLLSFILVVNASNVTIHWWSTGDVRFVSALFIQLPIYVVVYFIICREPPPT